MRFSKKHSGLAALAFLTGVLTGCFSTDAGPTVGEKNRSDSTAAAGTEKLDDIFQEMTSSQFEYGDGNLTALRAGNADFKAALKLNPGNNQARLGAAVTSVLLALQSERLSGLVNRTINAGSPLDPELVKHAPLARVSVLRTLSETGAPEVHELQDAVADTLLPVLETAIGQLRAVYDDAAFSMTLTLDGETREIDHGEITVLLAGFKSLHALVTLVLAYDLDFDKNGSYAYLDVIEGIDDISELTLSQKAALNTLTELLKVGSPYLAVKPAWKTRLGQVDNEISDALDILDAGLATLATETDSQEDDLLRLCAAGPGLRKDCIDRGDFDDGMNALDTLRKYMKQPYPVSVADTVVRVNFAAYFNIQDYKKLLPYYGFYPAGDWSADKPVFYFTNPAGVETGNIGTLADLFDRADAGRWSNQKIVDSLKGIIRWQDPTLQGFLPGTTEAKLWALILKLADEGEGPLARAAAGGNGENKSWRFLAAVLRPTFAPSLLGRD